MDTGHKVGVLFIDFCKAFHCVDHIIPAEKLKAVGVSGDMWSWINDYLTNCMQRTWVNNVRSDLKLVRVGVPQGSFLGPRLFATYVNGLLDHMTSGDLHMYAEHTKIYIMGNSVDDIVIILEEVLDQVNSWSLKNRLVLHEGKSEAMILSTKSL